MAITVTTAFKNTLLESGLDAVFNNGILEIRSGPPPGADAAPTGTVGATITLPADALATASAGAKDKNGTWQDTSADATITAGHFRLKTSADTGAATQNEVRVEGTVTTTGGGGDMQLDSVSITAGQSVTVTQFLFTI